MYQNISNIHKNIPRSTKYQAAASILYILVYLCIRIYLDIFLVIFQDLLVNSKLEFSGNTQTDVIKFETRRFQKRPHDMPKLNYHFDYSHQACSIFRVTSARLARCIWKWRGANSDHDSPQRTCFYRITQRCACAMKIRKVNFFWRPSTTQPEISVNH